MPTTFAHDLFGRNVYRELPEEMRTLIRCYGQLYRIGLHGPDIFFYNLPSRRVTAYGEKLHWTKARSFLKREWKRSAIGGIPLWPYIFWGLAVIISWIVPVILM